MFKTFINKFCAGYAGGRTVLLIVAVLLMSGSVGDAQRFAEESRTKYIRHDLVSTIFGRADNSDSSLVDPWGMARSFDGPWWVANEGKGRATLYSGAGIALPGLQPLVVIIPVNPGGIREHSTPVGTVYNDSSAFELAPDEPAEYIFATRDGTIAGWNSDVDRWNAVTAIDNSPDAAYTGVTIAAMRGTRYLYVADFAEGRVEVYESDFDPVTPAAGAFTDPSVLPEFSPYNVQNIGGGIYVTFAQRDADGRSARSGEGLGRVLVFDAAGSIILRLQHGPWMNAPWGVTLAPEGFGDFSNDVLVGNSGSGRIAAFDPDTGAFQGYLADAQGAPVSITGLHGLGFGNNGLAGQATTLYFTAGTGDGQHGLLGSITAVGLLPPREEK